MTIRGRGAVAQVPGNDFGEKLSEANRARMESERRNREARAIQVGTVSESIHDLRLHYRNEIHILEKMQRDASGRLKDYSTSPEESETCWAVLAESLPQLREAIAAYYILSFATMGERIDFVLYPERRAAAIQGVMNRGTVRDDSGVVMEVDLPCGHKADEVHGVELTFP